MKKAKGKTDGISFAATGFIVFSKYGDVWMGCHSKERLQEFVSMHPLLKLESIHEVSSRLEDVRILKPDHLKEKHIKALDAIPSSPKTVEV